MLRNAARRIVVADYTKFDKVSYAFLCDLADLDLIVTDQTPPPAYQQQLRTLNTDWIVAAAD